MGKAIDKSNLGYLDLGFQYKLAKYFVEEPRFFEDLVSIVDPNAFTDPLLRTFVGTIKDYYLKKGVVPAYDTIETLLRERSKVKTELEEWVALINKLKTETTFEGCDVVEETALRFFKQQNLIKAANKILEIAGRGDVDRYDECQRIFDEAAQVGLSDDFGYSIYDLEEKALANDYTVSIPTGIKNLDEVLGGGLDKGKIGLIIAAAGFGKTSFTTAICAHAASYKCPENNYEGYKVLQIYFEDDDVDITRKHFSKITQLEARHFKRLDDDEKERVASLIDNFEDKEMLKKNLRLKKFKTGTKSATDIELFIKRLKNSGFKPDLISIDYFECLAPEKGGYQTDTEWTREGVTMRKLENMAHDFDCAIWVPTQGTKDSMNSPDVVRMDQASGSAKKVHVAQLIISIARGIGDIDRSRAVISILKNRSGKSGKIFNNVRFDNGTCTISCDDADEYDELSWSDEAPKKREEDRTAKIRQIQQEQRFENQSFNKPIKKTTNGNFIGTVAEMNNFDNPF
jgi:replicative DNA helicase